MRRRTATILAIVGMMPTGAPGAFAFDFAPEPLIGRMCAHPAIPFPAPKRDGRHDCPSACHAACARSSRGECDEDDSD